MATVKSYLPASVYFDRARQRLDNGEIIASAAYCREAVRRALAERCRSLGLPVGQRSSSELLRELGEHVDTQFRLDLTKPLRVCNRAISTLCITPTRMRRSIDTAQQLCETLKGGAV